MVGGPSLACENQNKPLHRPNDAIMKVVLSPSSRRAPPPWLQSLLRLGPGTGSPSSASASQFVRQGGAVAVVAVKGENGKDSKAGSLVDLHLDCSLKPLTGTRWNTGMSRFAFSSIFCSNRPAEEILQRSRGAVLVWRQWPRCSFYLVTIHQFMT